MTKYSVIISGTFHDEPLEWEYDADEYGNALDQYCKKCKDHIMGHVSGHYMVQLRMNENGSSIVMRKLDMISTFGEQL